MPLLRIPVLLPSMGMDYSRPATLLNNENSFPQNMSFYRGDIKKRYGRSLNGDVAISGAPVMGMGKMELSSGTRYMVRASQTTLQKYNETSGAWDTINVTPFSGDTQDYFDFANDPDDDLLIIVNGVNNTRKWTGSGNNQALDGDPGIAGTVCYLAPYIILGNLIESTTPYPYKTKWCDTSAPETWSGGNAGSQALSDEPSALLKLKKLNEYAAAYKENSLWLGRKDVSDTIVFSCVRTGVGLFGKHAVAEAQYQHFFMGDNDFYSWDGANLTSIGKAVRDEVFSTIDKTKNYRCFALHNKAQNEVWFFVVTSGQTYPTQVWKYNYNYGIWYFDTCSNITSGIEFIGNTFAERFVISDSSGYSYKEDSSTYNDNGVAVNCRVDTKDFTANRFEAYERWMQLDIWAYGSGTLSVDYSTDRGTTWTSLSSATLDSAMPTTPITMWFDVVASHIRFRFRNSTVGEYFFLRKFYPYYLQREEQWR